MATITDPSRRAAALNPLKLLNQNQKLKAENAKLRAQVSPQNNPAASAGSDYNLPGFGRSKAAVPPQGNPVTTADLLANIRDLEQQNDQLQDTLDLISDVAAPIDDETEDDLITKLNKIIDLSSDDADDDDWDDDDSDDGDSDDNAVN
jgi:cell division protein FtsB